MQNPGLCAHGMCDSIMRLPWTHVTVMCSHPCRRKKLGSVSQQVSTSAYCTTLIIKDSYEILKNRYSTGSKSISADLCGRA